MEEEKQQAPKKYENRLSVDGSREEKLKAPSSQAPGDHDAQKQAFLHELRSVISVYELERLAQEISTYGAHNNFNQLRSAVNKTILREIKDAQNDQTAFDRAVQRLAADLDSYFG